MEQCALYQYQESRKEGRIVKLRKEGKKEGDEGKPRKTKKKKKEREKKKKGLGHGELGSATALLLFISRKQQQSVVFRETESSLLSP